MQNYILPSTAFVVRSRSEIQLKLAESLHHIIFDVLSAKFDPPVSEQNFHNLMSGETNFPKPTVFALHGALLNAVLDDDLSEVPELFRILKNSGFWKNWEPDRFLIKPLSEKDMHRDDVLLLKRAFADDIGLTTTLIAPTHSEVERGTHFVNEAMQTLEQTAPDWMEELLLLANQIYFAVADTESRLLFGGAAVFDAFGAVLMNPLGCRSAPEALMTLIHESSHQQMFLFHLKDPILHNDAAAAYASPLRAQPRPMEGIFHALWVSARMVAAAEAVLKSPDRPTWAEDLRAHQTSAYGAFRDCEYTVAKHAELSDLGQALFKSAQETINAI
jgi:hypothetical protein